MITDGETIVYHHVRSSRTSAQPVRRHRSARASTEASPSSRLLSDEERLRELEARVAALEKRLSQLGEQRRQAAESCSSTGEVEQAQAAAFRTSPGSGIKVSLYPSGGTTAVVGEARIIPAD